MKNNKIKNLTTEFHGGRKKNHTKNSVLLRVLRGFSFLNFHYCTWLLIVSVFILTLSSCIGVSADIQMRADGSGRIALEYRISRMAETIGRLDGNENWPIVPVGRADWERTVARIDGMRLVSFSGSETAQDIVNKVTLEFSNTDALVKFFDPSGKRAAVSRENGSNKLHITFNEGASSQIDPNLLDLVKQVCAGYLFSVSFSAQGNSTMSVTDSAGRTITPPSGAVLSGRKVSLSVETGEIVSSADGLAVSFNWE